ncbi:MAG: hypothetical protein AAF790_09785, partial [Planctomycetota bacterium]
PAPADTASAPNEAGGAPKATGDRNGEASPAGGSTASPPTGEPSLADLYNASLAGPTQDTPPQRKSRRQQMSEVSAHPFVQKAMELFDVAPDKLRYNPPSE